MGKKIANDIFENITLPEDLQIFSIEKNILTQMKSIKNITPKAKLAFICQHPELINPKIEKLNSKELKAYKEAIEKYNINLVKQDYKNIEKIKNPSKTVKDIAIKEFMKKQER